MSSKVSEHVYKKIGNLDLILSVYEPISGKRQGRGCIIFFGGGGWRRQSREQFKPQSEYLAGEGFVAVCADYRARLAHDATILEAVDDARSAIRWVKDQATLLGVDPKKVIAAGGSAGAHLAACTAYVPSTTKSGNDDRARPCGAVLFNPPLDMVRREQRAVEAGHADEFRFGCEAREISPHHHIGPDLPPALIFHGTEDAIVPFAEAQAFRSKMEGHGNLCFLRPAPGEGHGFFSLSVSQERNGREWFDRCVKIAADFMRSLFDGNLPRPIAPTDPEVTGICSVRQNLSFGDHPEAPGPRMVRGFAQLQTGW